MRIAENAIDFELMNSGRKAIFHLGHLCERAISELPAYSELWLLNPDNQNNPAIDKEKAWKRDWTVDSVVYGYFSAFAKLGSKAANRRLNEITGSLSLVMAGQIAHIIDHIKEERYQNYLLRMCLGNLEEIVKASCEMELVSSISLGFITSGAEKIESGNNAMLLANSFGKFLQLMAKAEILDQDDIMETSVMTVYLAHKFPQATIPILKSLGMAGEAFRNTKSDIRRENLNYLCYEISQRIDQVENAGLATADKEIKAEISLTAKTAKKKTDQKPILETRKVTKSK